MPSFRWIPTARAGRGAGPGAAALVGSVVQLSWGGIALITVSVTLLFW